MAEGEVTEVAGTYGEMQGLVASRGEALTTEEEADLSAGAIAMTTDQEARTAVAVGAVAEAAEATADLSDADDPQATVCPRTLTRPRTSSTRSS